MLLVSVSWHLRRQSVKGIIPAEGGIDSGERPVSWLKGDSCRASKKSDTQIRAMQRLVDCHNAGTARDATRAIKSITFLTHSERAPVKNPERINPKHRAHGPYT